MRKNKYIETLSDEIVNTKSQERSLTREYYFTNYKNTIQKQEIFKKLFGSIGKNVSIDTNIYCIFGKNIHIGNDVTIGSNCTFTDNEEIRIGNCVTIASNLRIYTAYYPALPEERYIQDRDENKPIYFNTTCAEPVEIKDGAWIGGGVIILPGVTIGKNSIIGAGSVVTRSIPDNCTAIGNPCKPIKFFDKIRNNKN